MSYRPLPEIAEPAEELRQRLRHEHNAERKERLHLLVLIHDEQVHSQAETAERLAHYRNTISDGLGRYRTGGLHALLAAAPRGQAPGQRTLPEPVFEALKEPLAARHSFSGYDDIQRWLHQEYDLEVPYTRCPTRASTPRALPSEVKAEDAAPGAPQKR